jgi:hypothetical protein
MSDIDILQRKVSSKCACPLRHSCRREKETKERSREVNHLFGFDFSPNGVATNGAGRAADETKNTIVKSGTESRGPDFVGIQRQDSVEEQTNGVLREKKTEEVNINNK